MSLNLVKSRFQTEQMNDVYESLDRINTKRIALLQQLFKLDLEEHFVLYKQHAKVQQGNTPNVFYLKHQQLLERNQQLQNNYDILNERIKNAKAEFENLIGELNQAREQVSVFEELIKSKYNELEQINAKNRVYIEEMMKTPNQLKGLKYHKLIEAIKAAQYQKKCYTISIPKTKQQLNK